MKASRSRARCWQTVEFRFGSSANERNQGVYHQWLRGIAEANGELVWIAEADDDCSPRLLETLVPTLVNSNVVLAYAQSTQIDDQGHEIATDYLDWTDDVTARNGDSRTSGTASRRSVTAWSSRTPFQT